MATARTTKAAESAMQPRLTAGKTCARLRPPRVREFSWNFQTLWQQKPRVHRASHRRYMTPTLGSCSVAAQNYPARTIPTISPRAQNNPCNPAHLGGLCRDRLFRRRRAAAPAAADAPAARWSDSTTGDRARSRGARRALLATAADAAPTIPFSPAWRGRGRRFCGRRLPAPALGRRRRRRRRRFPLPGALGSGRCCRGPLLFLAAAAAAASSGGGGGRCSRFSFVFSRGCRRRLRLLLLGGGPGTLPCFDRGFEYVAVVSRGSAAVVVVVVL